MRSGRWGKIAEGTKIPYGAFNNVAQEIRLAYYVWGYKNDRDLPELPYSFAAEEVELLENTVYRNEMASVLRICIDELTPREQKVIRMRYEIDSDKLTLREVGELHGVSPERVRQIEYKALRKLRRRLYIFFGISAKERYPYETSWPRKLPPRLHDFLHC
jgi:RNA polymerase primary sigma factor